VGHREPPETAALFRQAVDEQQRGQFEHALELYLRLLDRCPEAVEAYNNAAMALQTLGRTDEALALYDRAIGVRPDFGNLHNNRGALLHELGRHDEALAAQQRAAELLPASAQAQYNLGNSYIVLGRYREAIPPLERAIALDAGMAEAHNALGAAFAHLDCHDDAVAHFRTAFGLRPGFADAHANLGIALREVGNIAGAASEFRAAISLAPQRGEFYRHLVETTRVTPDDPEPAAMERLISEQPELAAGDRMELHFALGKVYNDASRYDESFEHLKRANALKRASIAYDEAAALALVENAFGGFGEDAFADAAGDGHPSDVAVFIFGMPRSGTTLVEQLLAAHPAVRAAGEIDAFEHAYREISAKGGTWRELGERYLEISGAAGCGAARFTDKTLLNFRFAGAIRLALPNARMIHVRRDPLDTCLSCYATHFVEGLGFTFDLEELGRYYLAYERAMRHWQRILPPGTLLHVQYEELVGDFERCARSIVEHCGLAWDAACLDYASAKRHVRTASAAQVRRPLYRSSIGRSNVYSRHLEPLAAILSAGNV
jgi:tetratricopeptide (TPR) repeat protein